jgi:hypothetical protein
MRDVLRDAFPRCSSSLEALPEPWPLPRDLDGKKIETVPDYRTKLTYAPDGRVVAGQLWIEGVDANGEPCRCGTMSLRAAGVTSSSVVVRSIGNGTFVVLDARSMRDGIGAFRIVHGKRHIQADRLFTRAHLPALVALFALGALAIGWLRARSGIAYATRMHAWTEASLDAGGRVESDTGETLGVLDSTGRRVLPGTILVAPSAAERTGGLYRDVPILPRRKVAVGSHALWREATMGGLRDARALCAISAVCSAFALAAVFLAGA